MNYFYHYSVDNADDIYINKKLSMNKLIAASDYTVLEHKIKIRKDI